MKRKTSAAIAAMVVLSMSLLGGGAPGAAGSSAKAIKAKRRPCRGAYLRPTRANIAQVAAATLCLIERERAAHGLRAVRSNRDLQRLAANQSADMVRGDYFGDDSMAGRTPVQRITASRYAWRARSLSTAQNIGWGTERLASPAATVSQWMRSPPHRLIMLTAAYRDIGVGVAPAAPRRMAKGMRGATYTVELASRG